MAKYPGIPIPTDDPNTVRLSAEALKTSFEMLTGQRKTTDQSVVAATKADIASLAPIASPSFTGTISVDGYAFGTNVQYNTVGYNVLYDGSGSTIALYLGNASDPSNYYQNNNHIFRSKNGSTIFGTFSAAGLNVATGALTATKLSIGGSTIAAAFGAAIRPVANENILFADGGSGVSLISVVNDGNTTFTPLQINASAVSFNVTPTAPTMANSDASVSVATTAFVGGVWTAYTPTVTAISGTLTASATGRYKQSGKLVHFEFTVTITAVGTASGGLYVTLPVTSANTQAVQACGREDAITGKMLQGKIFPNTTLCVVVNYDNSANIAAGGVLFISGAYEAA